MSEIEGRIGYRMSDITEIAAEAIRHVSVLEQELEQVRELVEVAVAGSGPRNRAAMRLMAWARGGVLDSPPTLRLLPPLDDTEKG